MENDLPYVECPECETKEPPEIDGKHISGEEILWYSCPNCGYTINSTEELPPETKGAVL